jgi:hypothetical protein
MHGIIEQQRDPVTGSGALGEQVPGQLVGSCVQLLEGQHDVTGVHGELVGSTVFLGPITPPLEYVIETLAAAPA